MDWGTTAIPVLGLLLSGTAAYFGLRAELRSTERSDVVWETITQPDHPGRIALANRGCDTAYKVEAEAWTRHERSPVITSRKVKPDTFIGLILEERERNGPDHVDLPPMTLPDPGDTPPSTRNTGLPDFMAAARSNLDAEWKVHKAAFDEATKMRDQMRREGEARQVTVCVRWRSRRGVWQRQEFQGG